MNEKTLDISKFLQGQVLKKSIAHFQRAKGPDLIARTDAYLAWEDERREFDTWSYTRSLDRRPGPITAAHTETNLRIEGVNFASQDYLSLASHPAITEAAAKALYEFGPHSAGSGMLLGNTSLSLQLEAAIADMLDMNTVVLFPTGWGAGFGAVTGLVRPDDHIVMDKLAHNCLQTGANAATSNITRHPHLDAESVGNTLKDIRSRDRENGILVITEGLFSMDSDTPDIQALQAACTEFGATLLVDVAHDLGALGPRGSGAIGIQNVIGKVDLVMGAFSKSFASNGGFLASKSRGVKHFVKWFGSPHVFSNALSPVQTAVVLKAIEIIRSEEGDQLRAALMRNVLTLRKHFQEREIRCIGDPSAIVPVAVGSEKVARVATALLQHRNVLVNLVEFPAVAVGSARFRLQVMASHEPEHLAIVAEAVSNAIREAELLLDLFQKC